MKRASTHQRHTFPPLGEHADATGTRLQRVPCHRTSDRTIDDQRSKEGHEGARVHALGLLWYTICRNKIGQEQLPWVAVPPYLVERTDCTGEEGCEDR